MKNFIWDKLYVGMLAGILPPIIAFLTYYFLNYNYMSRGEFFRFLARGEMYTQIVTLCVIVNLIPFYIFINKEKYNATKGVLASTFIWAGVVLFLKFYIEP